LDVKVFKNKGGSDMDITSDYQLKSERPTKANVNIRRSEEPVSMLSWPTSI
jgi:hypothetical protein